MQSTASSVEEYCAQVPAEQKDAFDLLRATILAHLPHGFEECMNYGMIGYVVPHTLYPLGYHCNPKLPLPFMWLAYQKNSINMYHMWLYADPILFDWFVWERPKHTLAKLDMGKSCIRFKKYDQIPYVLIGLLVEKVHVKDWVRLYEEKLKR